MVCFPTRIHSCEGACAHHCYSNPYTAGRLSRVCLSSAYVTDEECGDDCVLSNHHVMPVYCCDKNMCTGVYVRADLHPGVCETPS